MKIKFILTVFFLAILLSCRPSRPAISPSSGYVETGIASWYGDEFHGKKTSSQEVFDMHDLTAAHPTLPFGTTVLVTNLENGRSVTVRINDRGPFVRDRIIDLSYAAARMLGMIGPGTVRVRIEVVGSRPVEEKIGNGQFILQMGSFIKPENARALYLNLKKDFPGVYVSTYETKTQVYYRVRLRVRTEAEARKLGERLASSSYPVLLLKE